MDADVKYRGQRVAMELPTRLFATYKPKNVFCVLNKAQMSNLKGRKTLRDVIAAKYNATTVQSGIESEPLPDYCSVVHPLKASFSGLVVCTNDGDFARALRDPDARIQTVYRLKAIGPLPADYLRSAWNGIVVDNVDFGPVWVEVLAAGYKTANLRVRYVETKERDLSMFFDAFRLRILNVERVAFGPIRLDTLPISQRFRIVPTPAAFRKFLPKADTSPTFIPCNYNNGKSSEDALSIFDRMREKSKVATLPGDAKNGTRVARTTESVASM